MRHQPRRKARAVQGARTRNRQDGGPPPRVATSVSGRQPGRARSIGRRSIGRAATTPQAIGPSSPRRPSVQAARGSAVPARGRPSFKPRGEWRGDRCRVISQATVIARSSREGIDRSSHTVTGHSGLRSPLQAAWRMARRSTAVTGRAATARSSREVIDRSNHGDGHSGLRAIALQAAWQWRGDRPPSDRPSGDRPFKPRRDRPFKPGGDRPFKPHGDRPFRPTGDRPFKPRGDRPFKPRGDRPFRTDGERSFKPKGDRPFKPRGGGSRPWRPGGHRPGPPKKRDDES